MADTAIEWADRVWNPTTGCDRVSPGCDHCYALTMAKRLKGMGSAKYQRDGDPRTSGPGFGLSIHPDTLGGPLKWRKPQRIFVNSMSDLFHASVPDDYIAKVWAVMAMAPQHTFQILTKRHARMCSLISDHEFGSYLDHEIAEMGGDSGAMSYNWPLPNVWLGVSAENQQWADIRIPALLDTPAAVRFVSAEPLLGPVDPTHIDVDRGDMYQVNALTGRNTDMGRPCADVPSLDWVIVGGESGRGARPMHPDWARGLRDQCEAAGVAYLFKQFGEWTPYAPPGIWDTDTWLNRAGERVDEQTAIRAGGDFVGMWRVGKHRAGRHLDGQLWDQYPEAVTV